MGFTGNWCECLCSYWERYVTFLQITLFVHFVHLYMYTFMKLAWKVELLVPSEIGSVLTFWFLYPSSPVHVIQLKLICGLWLLSRLIHSHLFCPGFCIPPHPMRTISLESIAHTTPPNLPTLCTLLPESTNSGPEKTNSLLGSCVLWSQRWIVHCLTQGWPLSWRRLKRRKAVCKNRMNAFSGSL